jgi:hypothetical protein
MNMQIATSFSVIPDAKLAMIQAYSKVRAQLPGDPHFLVFHASVANDCEILIKTLKELAPQVPVHGGTSCLGVMTDQGFHSDEESRGMGILGIFDPEGAYGMGCVEIGTDIKKSAIAAAHKALVQANRVGEAPAIVWMMTTPGTEEQVIEGLSEVFGTNVPVAGGSSADNDVSGKWKQFENGKVHQNSVVVSVLFPSSPITFSFQGGYDVTETQAVVTKGGGRVIEELDGKPAAKVYNDWTEGAISEAVNAGGGNVLMKTSLHPLGRIVGELGGFPYFQLSHPDSVTANSGLTVFTDVQVGEKFFLMHGTSDGLVTRSERVVQSALRNAPTLGKVVKGALVIYCAGCMLTVKEQMPEVVAQLKSALGKEVPFLGAFTFGEQGCFFGGENRHGNLMISLLLFLE